MRYPERRYAERIETDFAAAMTSNEGKHVVRVLNLSAGGLQLQRDRTPVRAGERLNLRFRLPTGAGPIQCDADVVYRDGKCLGLRFSTISHDQQLVLDRYLNRELSRAWFH